MPLPGDPAAIEDSCRQLGAAARSVQITGESVAAHGRAITADWTGLASPLALAWTQQDAANAQRVAQAVDDAVGALTRYAEELRAAQQDHASGEEMVAQGQAVVSAPQLPAQQAVDEGAALMRSAEKRARAANEAAARALDAAASSLAGIAPPPPPPAAPSTSPMAEVGNAVASFGMAVLENPLDVAAVVGGGTLAALGVTGVLAGAAATATGGGALVGVPGAAASAAGVTAGVGLASAGLIDLATHATTDSAVAPFQVDQKRNLVEGPAPYPPPTEITGMTKHGDEQAESRDNNHGVSDEAMRDAVDNPTEEPFYDVRRDTYEFRGKDAAVVLNRDGKVVTTWARNSQGYRHP